MFRIRTATARRCVAVTLLCSLAATASATQGPAPAPGARKPPTSVRFIDAPSAESPAARKKRLKKECKGRPNAGACLGHTGRD